MADTTPLTAEERALAGEEPSNRRSVGAKAAWRPVIPVPDAAPPLPNPTGAWGSLAGTWEYRDAEGRLLFYVQRFLKADGGKNYRPFALFQHPRGQYRWLHEGVPGPYPLYGLPELVARPDTSVLVVEGEKSADAGRRLFPDMVVTTSPFGAYAASRTEWSPLTHRAVVIWPDQDDPGRTYAATVASLALQAGATSVKIVDVDPTRFPDGWDLADECPEGVTIDTLGTMVAGAKPITAPPPPAAPLRLVPPTPVDHEGDQAPLGFVEALPNRSDVEDAGAFSTRVMRALEAFAEALAPYSDLERQALRAAAVELLQDRGVRGPASLVDKALEAAPPPPRIRVDSGDDGGDSAGPYAIENGCIVLRKYDRDGNAYSTLLCNFTAEIVEEVDLDDGSGQSERRLTIAGALAGGNPLPPASVTASQFTQFNWVVDKWGSAAVVNAGMTTRDNLRAAVQMLSAKVERRVVKTFTGWTRYLQEWRYVHGGGSIGADGVHTDLEVQLPRQLQQFVLPEPPEGDELVTAVRASLALAEVGPDRLTLPLLAAVYRSVLGEVAPIDHSLFLTGRSGTFKSCLAALAQAHWGRDFTAKTLPTGWSSTANSLERLAFQTKDAILTIDDFAPSGGRGNVNHMHQEAERLLRAAGNVQGRMRMTRNGGMAPEYHPRGLILSTGEDVPVGLSLRARMLILEVAEGDADTARLTKAQAEAAAGQYAGAMAGYVQYLAPRLDDLKVAAPARLLELRKRASEGSMAHRRTPEVVASLQWGMETFLTFAQAVGAVTTEEVSALEARTWDALGQAAAAQGAQLADADPVARFVALLGALFVSGRAHVTDATTGERPANSPTSWGWQSRETRRLPGGDLVYEPQGRHVGWVEPTAVGAVLYLEPDAIYAEAQKFANEQNESIPVTARTLFKRLAERGVIQPDGDGHTAVKKRGLGGEGSTRRRVLVMPWPPQTGATGASGAAVNADAGLAGPNEDLDPNDGGPASGAERLQLSSMPEAGPTRVPPRPLVGPALVGGSGPVELTLLQADPPSGPGGPALPTRDELLQRRDEAYQALQSHSKECARCAAGLPCEEVRGLNETYHTLWTALQEAHKATGEPGQPPRPDREPGDDDEAIAEPTTPADVSLCRDTGC